MPVGLITSSLANVPDYLFTADDSSATARSIHTLIGSPSSERPYTVVIQPNVTQSGGAGDPAGGAGGGVPVLDFETGFTSGYSGTLIILGTLAGAGGDGGWGGGNSTAGDGGGGGRGAGTGGTLVIGAGWETGTDGSDSTATTGGTGGANALPMTVFGSPGGNFTAAGNGADAIHLNHPLTIYLNTGTLASGGGGGRGGTSFLAAPDDEPMDGGLRGDPGVTVVSSFFTGLGGWAVRYSGAGAATVINNGGTLIGNIG